MRRERGPQESKILKRNLYKEHLRKRFHHNNAQQTETICEEQWKKQAEFRPGGNIDADT